MSWYTGLGAQNAPERALRIISHVALGLARRGLTLRTGIEQGSDAAFAKGSQGQCYAYCRPLDYGRHPYPITSFDAIHMSWCRQNIEGFSQLPLEEREWWAMTRAQLTGIKGDQPSRFLLVWTPDGTTKGSGVSKATGHTQRSILIAEALGIPCFNLKREDHARKFLTLAKSAKAA